MRWLAGVTITIAAMTVSLLSSQQQTGTAEFNFPTIQVAIQVFMPDGSQPGRPLQFTLTSGSGYPVTYVTDFNGWAQLAVSLDSGSECTITFETDGQSYGFTTVYFRLNSGNLRLPIFLNPLKRQSGAAAGSKTVSVRELQKPPKEALAAHRGGLRAVAAGNWKEAAAQFERAISLCPIFSDALIDLGVILLRQGNLERATELLALALESAPGSELALLNLALVRNRQNRFDDAIELLKRLRLQNPSDSRVLVHLADALSGQGRLDEAEHCLQEALKAGGLSQAEKGRIHRRRGQILSGRQLYPAAVKELSKAVKMLPEDPQARLELGAAAYRAGMLSIAERELQRAYRIGGAEVAVSQLLLGQIYCRGGQYGKAREAFERFLLDSPNAPESSEVRTILTRLDETETDRRAVSTPAQRPEAAEIPFPGEERDGCRS